VALFDKGAEDKAADAAESVDGDGSHDCVWGTPKAASPPGGRELCMAVGRRQHRGIKAHKMRGFQQTARFAARIRG
jgi:hypothetical protein